MMSPSKREPSDQHADSKATGSQRGQGAAWQARAATLAAWAWATLVNRTDVWGGYRPLHLREPGNPNGKIWTKPAKKDRGRIFLTEAIIACHYAGRDVGHLIGLHSTSPANTCRWGAVDIDCHGPTSTPPEVNLAAVLAWYGRLAALGFSPLLTDSNGQGGYHLLAIFREPVTTPKVFDFLRWLVSDHAIHGLTAPPETFPKQPWIQPGRYGNWLRLPGRHHTREHWSRVWNGTQWLAGADAVGFILGLAGDRPSLIPDAATLSPSRPAPSPTRRHQVATSGDLSGRIRRFLAKLPTGLGEGEHRDDYAYRFAAFLVRDLKIADGMALQWLLEWDRGNQTPKGETRLREIIQSAHLYGQHAYGAGLGGSHSRGRAKGFEITVKVRI
jgi:hypothetical protein